MKTTADARNNALQLWLDQGWPVHRLRAKAADLWGLTDAQTDIALAGLRQKSVGAMSMDRQEFLAQQMIRLEALAVKAQEEGNLPVALGCLRELNQLAGLHGKG